MKTIVCFSLLTLAAACAHPSHPPGHAGHDPHHHFRDAEHWAQKFDDPARDSWQKPQEVVRLMGIKAGQTVADLGAGTGYFLPYLDRAVGTNGQVLALDVEPSLVAHMQKRIEREKLGSTKAMLIKTDNPRLADGSVHHILIVDTWHHIDNRADYSQRLAKALKPGGAVVVVDFDPQAGGPGPGAAHRLPSSVVEAELQSAGLKTRLEKTSLPYQYVVIATH